MTRLVPGLLLVLTGCAGAEAPAEKPVDPVATVRTAVATTGAAPGTIAVYGAAEAGPGNERGLAIEAEARLARIVAPTGTAVRAGQVIAVLEPTPATRLDAVKAQGDAAVAQRTLARAQRLRADGLMSDADVEAARAAVATGAATLASAAQRGATLTLRAPATGTVQALTAKPGDILPAGTAVATIAVGGELRARFGLDPALATGIHAGQPIRIAAIRSATSLSTSVAGVDPQVDATTRLASVFARLPASSGIGPGEALRAELATGVRGAGVTIPYAALLDAGGRSFVFVVKAGVAHARDVTPGNSSGDSVAVLRGIAAGERVVVVGATALDDGMKVREAAR